MPKKPKKALLDFLLSEGYKVITSVNKTLTAEDVSAFFAANPGCKKLIIPEGTEEIGPVVLMVALCLKNFSL